MKNIAGRLERLEKVLHTRTPVFKVDFADGTSERLTIVQLALTYFHMEAGIAEKKVKGHHLLRGDAKPFHKLAQLIGVEW